MNFQPNEMKMRSADMNDDRRIRNRGRADDDDDPVDINDVQL